MVYWVTSGGLPEGLGSIPSGVVFMTWTATFTPDNTGVPIDLWTVAEADVLKVISDIENDGRFPELGDDLHIVISPDIFAILKRAWRREKRKPRMRMLNRTRK